MSVPGQRRSVFVVVTLGMLGAGCERSDSQEEYSHQQAALTNASRNWNVKGIVRGTSQHDELLDVLAVSQDTVFVAGYENGRDGLAPIDPSGSSTDGALVKYTFDATQVPQRNLQSYLGSNNGADDVIESLAVDPDRNFQLFFTGRTTGSFGGKSNQGQFDTLVGWWDHLNKRFNPMTDVFQFGDNRPQHPRRLDVKDTQIVIGGYNDYTVSGGAVESWEDPYLLKLQLNFSTSGKPRSVSSPATWQAQFGTSYSDTALGMYVDPSTFAIYLTGNNSGGQKRGMFVYKYNAAGARDSDLDERPSPISMDMAAAVVKHPTEGLLFAGSTYGVMGSAAVGDQDVVIRQIIPKSESNRTAWTHQDGSAGPDWVTDMAVDAAGNIYVVGETLGAVDTELGSQGGYDIFLIKLSADRTKRKVFQMGSAGDDHPSAISVIESNTPGAPAKVYIVGYTTGNLGLPRDNRNDTNYLEPTPGNFGGRDGFLLQLTPTEGDVSTEG